MNTLDRTAFGELSVAQPTPEVQLTFPYNINANAVDSRANQSGAITQATSMAVVSTGAATNSGADLLSKRPLKYNAGQGGLVRFTARFTTAAAGSTQWIGLGDAGDGFFFGYSGTSFGLLRRTSGNPEVRTLTVSTASSHAENITITLDGDAKADVAVTNTADTTLTANEIAAADYSDVGTGWSAEAVGATVVFTSWDAAAHEGTFSLSSATSAVGTFAQTLAALVPTESFTAQANWNQDTMLADAPSGQVLDPTVGNVYQIRFQWLGFGQISYYVENNDDGQFRLVHVERYANKKLTPSIQNPSLPLCASVRNTTNDTAIVLRTASMAAFIEGQDSQLGNPYGSEGTTTSITTTELPVVTLRNNRIFQSKLNRAKIKVQLIAAAVEHSKPMIIRVRKNATLTGASFSAVSASDSVAQVDSSASAVSGGIELYSLSLGKTGNEVIDLSGDVNAGLVEPGEQLTVTAVASSGTGGEADASLSWKELL